MAKSKAPLRIISVDDIVDAKDLTTGIVEVPEWGGAVEVRSFNKSEQLAMRKEAGFGTPEYDSDRLELLMVVHGVVNPPMTAEHVGLLRSKNAGVVDRILKKILAISGQSEEAIAEAEKTFRPR